MATLYDNTIRAPLGDAAPPAGLRRDEVPIDLERTVPMRRWSWIVVMLLASVLFCWLTYALSWQRGVADLRVNAGARVERYAGSLRSTVDRYEFLPYLLSLHPYVHDLLLHPEDRAVVQRANDYLFDVNQRAKASAAYVIDANGLALAASNWREKATFVGQEYRFRPYFIDAIKGALGRFYGVGTTSGEPGYFVSQPIVVDGQIRGVVVVKLNLEWFQRAGADAAEPVVVADDHGVVFLSSEPRWQYRALTPLSPDVKAALDSTRQYYNQNITPLTWTKDEWLDADGEVVTVRDGRGAGRTRRFLAVQRKLGEPDWTLMYFAPLDQAIANARIAAVAAACLAAFTCLLGVAWNQRRQRVRDMLKSRELLQSAYAELGERVAERTADLQSANERLQTEVQERSRTEHELREAQSELVQASKLVTLGQMAAGITHELNQPLSALRSFSDNTRVLLERGEYAAAQENLEAIASLTDRMGKITGQLRLFAGRARHGDMEALVHRALDNTLMLLRGRLAGIHVTTTFADGLEAVQVACEGLRLEQVLINLVGNAIDAVVSAASEHAPPSIWIDVDADDLWVRIYVRDNGPGISEAHMPRLFEPFFSTKEGGQGMGLGLAISSSIAQENGGQLVARNVPGGGAEFLVTLRRVQRTGTAIA
ncbi:sensor histidine kinase [Pandoraea communis]|uniref:C4-dicarboxylate transport sensor protein DctB n=1 Tax=Pandoraea communis TaxID=2508297 RepID=A0A5E4RV21_9BURK|nr:ATP-binding protein [Pandoraea communis]MDM8355399.1 ATP-binding protein [Pandoraea communis]VVD65799.1 C4-dicarboxylate transport sensor protein DctB [Pandoraea communis]